MQTFTSCILQRLMSQQSRVGNENAAAYVCIHSFKRKLLSRAECHCRTPTPRRCSMSATCTLPSLGSLLAYASCESTPPRLALPVCTCDFVSSSCLYPLPREKALPCSGHSRNCYWRVVPVISSALLHPILPQIPLLTPANARAPGILHQIARVANSGLGAG